MLLGDNSDWGTAETFIHGGVDKKLQLGENGDWLAWDSIQGHWGSTILQPLNALTVQLRALNMDQAEVHIKRLRSAPGLARVLQYCEKMSEFNQATWNGDPNLLGLPNGVINLNPGDLRPARPEDYISLSTGANYNRSASAPRWEQFLQEIQPKADVQEYLHRLLGSGLVGSSCDQLFHFFLGSGANGKSRIVAAVEHTLGSYVGTAPTSLFVRQSDQSANRFSVARLAGKRLIFTSEVPKGRYLDEMRVKQLTGEDTIVGEEKFKSQIEMRLAATVIMICNEVPRISDSSHAMLRRLRVVPFDQTIPEEERDPHLDDKHFAEAEGILLWLIDGAQKWLREGLSFSSTVQQATQERIRQSFTTFDFFEETIERASLDCRVTFREIQSRYENWAKGRGMPARLSQKELGAAIKDYMKDTPAQGGGHGTFYRGWQFIEDEVSFEAPYR